jgi:pSer/pThr/pTyr-binding forkhead associated (FHA) protein
MAKVIVMFGGESQGEFPLNKDELSVGRATTCDIVVDNLGISRHHCSLVRDGDGWAVADKGSNNGTYVNGQRVTTQRLKHQDRVVMGKHSLVFDAYGTAAPTDSKKKTAGMGGEMTMFVDQQALAKAMASNDPARKRMALGLTQGGRQVVVPLVKDETVVGAGVGVDIPVKGFLVKAIQARLIRHGEAHRLISLGGWRAVKVNGVKVVDHQLTVGDVISIAGNLLTYRQA